MNFCTISPVYGRIWLSLYRYLIDVIHRLVRALFVPIENELHTIIENCGIDG